MRDWEETIKDRLEGYESALPEGSYTDFCTHRSGIARTTEVRPFPLSGVIGVAVFIGLVAVLILRQTGAPKEENRYYQQLPVVQIWSDDSPQKEDSIIVPSRIAQASGQQVAHIETIHQEETVPVEGIVEMKEAGIPETEDSSTQLSGEVDNNDKTVMTAIPPTIPSPPAGKPMKLKTMSLPYVVGGSLLATLVTQIAGLEVGEVNLPGGQDNPYFYIKDIPSEDVLERAPSHQMPLIVGVSIRCPVWERINITTGLEYSLYSSSFTYALSGEVKQHVHYLGVPLRLDWTFASCKRFDSYIGAGIKGDYCLGASFAGASIPRDGPAFRLLGAGGIQFNATKRLGFYVEPEISWTIPSERRNLDTYCSNHPWMVTVVTGIRMNLNN